MSGKERCWEQDPKEALQGGDGEEHCAMWRLLSSAADQLKPAQGRQQTSVSILGSEGRPKNTAGIAR